MAWIAMKKWFEPFRKTPIDDQILEYRLYRYDLWFDALTDEEKKKEKERIEKIRERRCRNVVQLLSMTELCKDILITSQQHDRKSILFD